MRDAIDTAPLDLLRHVLWWAGEPITGQQPGGFEEHLLHAIAHADVEERQRLAKLYPDQVALVLIFRHDPSAKLRAALRVIDSGALRR